MNKFYMMIGLPASGKSTIARRISESEGAIIVSSDEIRKEMGDENDQTNNEKVFKEAEKRLKEYLSQGKDVIFDATNINYKRRRDWLNRFNKFDVEKIAVLVATPYEECLERNDKRKRRVPEGVIERMYFNFYAPQYYEGFDDIQIIYNSNDRGYIINELDDLEQDNPHHTLSVLEHCEKAGELLENEDYDLWLAGLLHDIGKLETKTFINAKGEKTKIAHFYNHEKVSTYDSLFYADIRFVIECGGDIGGSLYILKLIQWHMLLHLDLSEKTKNKYKNMLGEETWRDLEILHKADLEAR